jgi:hypothetical protein
MGAGEVCWHRDQTCYYLDGGRAIVVRQVWSGGWVVEESDGCGPRRILDSADTRGAADALAQLYASTRLANTGEVSLRRFAAQLLSHRNYLRDLPTATSKHTRMAGLEEAASMARVRADEVEA